MRKKGEEREVKLKCGKLYKTGISEIYNMRYMMAHVKICT